MPRGDLAHALYHFRAGMQRVEADLTEYGTVEQRPKMEGRQMVMTFGPARKNK